MVPLPGLELPTWAPSLSIVFRCLWLGDFSFGSSLDSADRGLGIRPLPATAVLNLKINSDLLMGIKDGAF